MRFARRFSRFVGGGGTVLGSDAVPAGRPREDDDRVMFARLNDSNGWPVHRVAVGFVGPPGAIALPTDMYLFDDLSGQWFRANSAPVNLISGRLTYFDVLGVGPPPPTERTNATSGSLEASFVIAAAGGDPVGEYIFAVAPDLTTIGVDSSATTIGTVAQGASGSDAWLVREVSKLVTENHDFIGLTYSGANLTVVTYRTGGSGGAIVATLTLAYTGARLDTVTRT